MRREFPPMHRVGRPTTPLPCPGRYHRGPIGASSPLQPALFAGPVAGSSTESCGFGRSFLSRKVALIARLYRPTVKDDDPRESFIYGPGHPRRFVQTRQRRRSRNAGRRSYVELDRRHNELACRWGCGPTAFGGLSGHATPSIRNRTRPGPRTHASRALLCFGRTRPDTRGFTRGRGHSIADPSIRRVCP
jgi:hypothetical protein